MMSRLVSKTLYDIKEAIRPERLLKAFAIHVTLLVFSPPLALSPPSLDDQFFQPPFSFNTENHHQNLQYAEG
jgi:hypothetical protein